MTGTDSQSLDVRLQSCLGWLIQACENWVANGLEDGPLVIAVSTPNAALVLRADGWAEADGRCSPQEAAAAIIGAVESGMSDAACQVIAAGVSLLLGPAGRESHLQDVTGIRAEGQIPVLLAMLVDADTVSFVTTGVPCPPPPGTTLH